MLGQPYKHRLESHLTIENSIYNIIIVVQGKNFKMYITTYSTIQPLENRYDNIVHEYQLINAYSMYKLWYSFLKNIKYLL